MKYAQYSIIGVALLFVFGIIVWKSIKPDKYHSPERIEWKNQAIRDLRDTDFKRDKPESSNLYEDWYNPHYMVMKNGEVVCLRSTDRDDSIEYLIIFRSSNHRWYFSSKSHLGSSALHVMASGQPDSVDELAREHSLKEFDPYSDDCLMPIN